MEINLKFGEGVIDGVGNDKLSGVCGVGDDFQDQSTITFADAEGGGGGET